MAKREKKIKPKIGWVWAGFAKEKASFPFGVTERSNNIDSIQVVVIPLDTYNREKADHKAQLMEAAKLIRQVFNCQSCDKRSECLNDDNFHCRDEMKTLKYLHSVTADKERGK